MLIIGLNNEELIAEFIPNNDYINVMQLGLDITDSETNITTKLNNILNTNLNLIFKNLIFDIDDELNLKSNTKLKLQNCHITNISDENKKYILNINEINNVEIEGINTILEFNKPETTQQACIHIKDAKNISIKGLTLQKAGGEGIIASGTADGDTENIVIYNCKIDNNRRNGIALIGGVYNVTIDNCEIINTSGTSPQFAIDLEPWTDNIYNDTITIKNCYIKGNTNGGIDILKQNKNILIEHNTFINNGIQSVATLSIGEDNYPKNCIIKNNTILGSLIYLRGIRYSQYSILNNYFDNNGRITIDTESDYTSINSGYPNGSLLIEGNTLNNVTGNQAISIGGARNVLVKNNTINNCSFRAVTIYSSYNVIIDSNIVNNYQTDENAENTGVALSTQTTTYLEIRNNNLYRDETHAMNLNKVIYIANNNNYVKVINNKAPVGNYTNMFDNGCTTAVFINNESKSLYNDTTLGLPTPSRNYLGLIYNYYDSLNDIYKPKICVYDTDTSDYIWLDLNT